MNRYVPFFLCVIFVCFFLGVFVRFSTRGVQKHPQKQMEKVHVKKITKKLRGGKNALGSRFGHKRR
jgi:hypothetical protein